MVRPDSRTPHHHHRRPTVKAKPIKPQYRWFIVDPKGDLCRVAGLNYTHAISLFMENGNVQESWEFQEARGYRCVRLLVSEPKK